MDLIIYVVREGYEIKTWLYNVPKNASDEEIEKLARAEYKRVGVELSENETFSWERF